MKNSTVSISHDSFKSLSKDQLIIELKMSRGIIDELNEKIGQALSHKSNPLFDLKSIGDFPLNHLFSFLDNHFKVLYQSSDFSKDERDRYSDLSAIYCFIKEVSINRIMDGKPIYNLQD
jgi:hypothetical protein